jgi:hypothetical protein
MGHIGADLRDMLTKYNWLKRGCNSGIYEYVAKLQDP